MSAAVRSASILFFALVVFAACGDDGPSGGGPATLAAEVQPPFGVTLGGVVLETTRRGVESFTPAPGTRLVSGSFRDGSRSGHRIVLLADAGTLGFSIRVADGGDGPVEFTVVEAVDSENRPVEELRRIRVRLTPS